MTRRRVRSARFALEGDLEGNPDLTRLEEGLAVDLAGVARALSTQARNYYAAALAHARLRAELAHAEASYTSTCTRVEAMVRDGLARRGEDASDAQVEYRVAANSEVERARSAVAAARRAELVADALKTAYEQRHAALLALAGREEKS